MKEDWIVFALISMILFSFSNLLLKLTVTRIEEKYDFRTMLLPSLLTVVAVIFIMFVLFGPKSFATDHTKAIVLVALLTFVGFVSFMAALHEGSVALVLTILNLGAPFVALLSFLFLEERFSLKEIVAILLAFASVIVLSL